jgi:hypothetical protein
MNHCLLPRVLGAPDVAASPDRPPQSRKVQLERDDVPHGEDDIAGSLIHAGLGDMTGNLAGG